MKKKDIKIKGIAEDQHKKIKVEAALRQMSMKDLICRSVEYVTSKQIEL